MPDRESRSEAILERKFVDFSGEDDLVVDYGPVRAKSLWMGLGNRNVPDSWRWQSGDFRAGKKGEGENIRPACPPLRCWGKSPKPAQPHQRVLH